MEIRRPTALFWGWDLRGDYLDNTVKEVKNVMDAQQKVLNDVLLMFKEVWEEFNSVLHDAVEKLDKKNVEIFLRLTGKSLKDFDRFINQFRTFASIFTIDKALFFCFRQSF
ncbi:hypothetical protein K7X08_032822 [Anisodus acutangulus]|uniref:Uncharacterized protein n=1 Tax=Anisodus acutangulus TaxID=402998 RepID=A0A9Q1M1K1_9SOLA|nr:hypothetical protein K7X08_032822 [Anisodus acutangulus]